MLLIKSLLCLPSTTAAESKGEVKLKLRVYRDISACAYHVQFTRIDAVARAHWLDTAATAADELDKFRVDMEPDEEEETRMQSSECRAELNPRIHSIKDKPIALRDY